MHLLPVLLLLLLLLPVPTLAPIPPPPLPHFTQTHSEPIGTVTTGYPFLALSEDVAVLGDLDYTNSDRMSAAGRALYYRRSGNTWALVQTLFSSNPRPSGRFGGGVALAAAGEWLVVGAPGEMLDSRAYYGRVYAYRRGAQDLYELVDELREPDVSALASGLGARVAGAATAPMVAVARERAEHVYVFELTDSEPAHWEITATLTGGDAKFSPKLNGLSIKLDAAATVVVIVQLNTALHLYERASVADREWSESLMLLSSQPALQYTNHLAASVDRDGTILVDGFQVTPSSSERYNAVDVWVRQGFGHWSMLQRLMPEISSEDSGFGLSSAVDEGILAIAATHEVQFRGAVYVYRRNASGLFERAQRLDSGIQTVRASSYFGTLTRYSSGRMLVSTKGPGGPIYFFQDPKLFAASCYQHGVVFSSYLAPTVMESSFVDAESVSINVRESLRFSTPQNVVPYSIGRNSSCPLFSELSFTSTDVPGLAGSNESCYRSVLATASLDTLLLPSCSDSRRINTTHSLVSFDFVRRATEITSGPTPFPCTRTWRVRLTALVGAHIPESVAVPESECSAGAHNPVPGTLAGGLVPAANASGSPVDIALPSSGGVVTFLAWAEDRDVNVVSVIVSKFGQPHFDGSAQANFSCTDLTIVPYSGDPLSPNALCSFTCTVPQGFDAGVSLAVVRNNDPATAAASLDTVSFPPPSLERGTLRLAGLVRSFVVLPLELDSGVPATLQIDGSGFFPDPAVVRVFVGNHFEQHRFECVTERVDTTSVVCTIHHAYGRLLSLTVAQGSQSSEPSDDRLSYPTAPSISHLTGCEPDPSVPGGVHNCPTTGGVTVTVFGGNFSDSTVVAIGGKQCESSVTVAETQINCVLPALTGWSRIVQAIDVSRSRIVPSQARPLVSFNSPTVESMSADGCMPAAPGADGLPLLVGCPRNATGVRLELRGHDFGMAGARVIVGGELCQDVRHLDDAGTALSCQLPSGNRRHASVIVLQQSSGSATAVATLGYEQCEAGTFERGFDCLNCTAGRFSAKSGETACRSCLKGLFQPLEGQSECRPCPGGTSSDRFASVDCDTCDAGKFAPPSRIGNDLCLLCEPGRYASSAGSQKCLECERGTFSARSGAAECTPCPPGSYTNYTRAEACTLCSIGRARPGQGGRDCVDCGVGTFAALEGSVRCVPCEPGSFATQPRNARCTRCAQGHYIPRGNISNGCELCPPRARCDSGVPVPVPGYWLDFDTHGKATAYRCANPACLDDGTCAADRLQPAADNVLCGECKPGTYMWAHKCRTCDSPAQSNALLALSVALYLAALFAFHRYVNRDATMHEQGGDSLQQALLGDSDHQVAPVDSTNGSAKLHIALYFVQTGALLVAPSLRNLSGVFGLFNLDLFFVGNGGVCLFKVSQSTHLWYPLLTPLVTTASLGLLVGVARALGRALPWTTWTAAVTTCVELMLATFNVVLTAILTVFDCEDAALHGESVRVNVAFPAVECGSDAYALPVTLSVLMMVFFVLVFALLVWLAAKEHRVVHGLQAMFRHDATMPRLTKNWWLVFALRRVAVSAAIVFTPNVDHRMASVTLLHFAFLALHLVFRPFAPGVPTQSDGSRVPGWLHTLYWSDNASETVSLALLSMLAQGLVLVEEAPSGSASFAVAVFFIVAVAYFVSRTVAVLLAHAKDMWRRRRGVAVSLEERQ